MKRRKIEHTVQFSDHLSSKESRLKIINAYKSETDLKTEPSLYSLVTEPYKVCTIYNVLKEKIAEDLLDELKELEFTFKENDLYSFYQTQDLNSYKSPLIKQVCQFLYTEVRSIVEKATKTKFSDKVDLHGVKFIKNQTLLCHSDSLEGRHTAFVLYLVPTWTENMGGTLDLFESDSSLQPTVVGKSLCPKFNSFSFFEVSETSWHQVSEVLTDDTRWSLSGWFHNETITLPPTIPTPSLSPPLPPLDSDLEQLKCWVNLRYLNVEVTSEAQAQFVEDSEIQLIDFIQPEMYLKLCNAVKSLKWESVGPRDRRHYSEAVLNSDNSALCTEFLELLKSDSMAILLSHVTGLSMTVNYEEAKPTSQKDFGILQSSVQKWSPGSYTLLKDGDIMNLPDRLQLFYHLDLPTDYRTEYGGYITFLSKGDIEPLLVIPPQSNCLSLVYTRTDEVGFTKFVNSKVSQPFYVITVMYQPIEDDDDEEEEEEEGEAEERMREEEDRGKEDLREEEEDLDSGEEQ